MTNENDVTEADRVAAAEGEIEHLRIAISLACRALRELSDRGGNGSDGHLWQQHRVIADKLMAESVWAHRDDREFVTREEFDEIARLRREVEAERNSLRADLAAAHAEGYAQCQREVVAWLRDYAASLGGVIVKSSIADLAAAIEQSAHRGDGG